jgi:hypothetical protein
MDKSTLLVKLEKYRPAEKFSKVIETNKDMYIASNAAYSVGEQVNLKGIEYTVVLVSVEIVGKNVDLLYVLDNASQVRVVLNLTKTETEEFVKRYQIVWWHKGNPDKVYGGLKSVNKGILDKMVSRENNWYPQFWSEVREITGNGYLNLRKLNN